MKKTILMLVISCILVFSALSIHAAPQPNNNGVLITTLSYDGTAANMFNPADGCIHEGGTHADGVPYSSHWAVTQQVGGTTIGMTAGGLNNWMDINLGGTYDVSHIEVGMKVTSGNYKVYCFAQLIDTADQNNFTPEAACELNTTLQKFTLNWPDDKNAAKNIKKLRLILHKPEGGNTDVGTEVYYVNVYRRYNINDAEGKFGSAQTHTLTYGTQTKANLQTYYRNAEDISIVYNGDAADYFTATHAVENNTDTISFGIKKYTTASKTITIKRPESRFYTAAQFNITIGSINKKPLTIKAKNQSIVYGSDIETGITQITATETVADDTISAIILTANNTNAGKTSITPSSAVIKKGDKDVTENYNILYEDGTLEIKKASRSMQITADLVNLTFGSTGTNTFSYTGDKVSCTVTSSDPNCVVASVADNTINLTPISANAAGVIITIHVPASDNYEAISKSFTATVSISENNTLYMPDGTTVLYSPGSGMKIVLEEYANYFDYYNPDDEEYVCDTTHGGEIVVARVYLHDALSFNTVGVALQFDESKLVPMNPHNSNGSVRYKYGNASFKAENAVTAFRADDTVYVASVIEDSFGNNFIYGCIGSTEGSTVLTEGENVQVMSILFAKVNTPQDIDETVLDFYCGEDTNLVKTYKSNWINDGKAINQITGLVTKDEVTLPGAFEITYPEAAPFEGVDFGNILNKAAACTGDTELYDEVLSLAKAQLDTVETITFSANKLSNGAVTAEGVYTPDLKKKAGSFHDSVNFTAKDANGVAVAIGIVTISYIVEDTLTITANPAEIEPGNTATLVATYALNNGYSTTPNVTYTMEANEYATLSGNVVTGIAYGTVEISATYEGKTATTTVTVVPPEYINLPDDTVLYSRGSGMEIVLEEYANYFDYYNVDDEEIVGDMTPGGEIVVARVYLHDELSFNTVGVALAFDKSKLVPMNPSMTNGSVKAVYGDAKFGVEDAITATRAEDTVYVSSILTDKFGTDFIYGCIGSTSGSTVLANGETVQVMSFLFAKADKNVVVDESVLDFYGGEDDELKLTYKTNWINKGKAINQFTGLVTPDEITIADAFEITYPEVPATITAIEVTVDDANLFVGETATLSAKAIYSDGTEQDIEATYTVDANGSVSGNVFTAEKAGKAVVTAIYGELTATVEIEIAALVATAIEVTADVTELEIGETATFTATATFNNGAEEDVTEDITITVFPADAATVSGNTVTVTKAGDIMVTVAYGAVSESVVLTAKPPEVTGLRGDVNCDGSVRMNDLVALLSHLSSGTELSSQGMVNADVNGDGAVRMNDLVGLLSFLSTGSWPF